jgi:hypothetical protein
VVLIATVVLPGHAFAQGRTAETKKRPAWFPCLPDEVKADDVAVYRKPLPDITVADKLKQLGAICVKRRLMTKRRKEIKFFRPQCWGVPPPNYQELQAEQSRLLKALQKRYVVVVIECDPRIP